MRAVAPLRDRRPRISADRRKDGARSRPPYRSRGDSALLVRYERPKAFAQGSARPREARSRRASRDERRSLRLGGPPQGRGTAPSARRRRRALPLQPRSLARLLPQGLHFAHDEGQDRHASRRPPRGARSLLGRHHRDGRDARRPHRPGAHAAGPRSSLGADQPARPDSGDTPGIDAASLRRRLFAHGRGVSLSPSPGAPALCGRTRAAFRRNGPKGARDRDHERHRGRPFDDRGLERRRRQKAAPTSGTPTPGRSIRRPYSRSRRPKAARSCSPTGAAFWTALAPGGARFTATAAKN